MGWLYLSLLQGRSRTRTVTFSRGQYVPVMFENRTTPGPDRELRFLCDEMLHGLGRYRRRASLSRTSRRCAEEDRVLLIKDRVLPRPPTVLRRSCWFQGTGSTKPHERCASLLASTLAARAIHPMHCRRPAARGGAAVFGDPGAGRSRAAGVQCGCAPNAAALSASRPCPPDAAPACCLATGGAPPS